MHGSSLYVYESMYRCVCMQRVYMYVRVLLWVYMHGSSLHVKASVYKCMRESSLYVYASVARGAWFSEVCSGRKTQETAVSKWVKCKTRITCV